MASFPQLPWRMRGPSLNSAKATGIRDEAWHPIVQLGRPGETGGRKTVSLSLVLRSGNHSRQVDTASEGNCLLDRDTSPKNIRGLLQTDRRRITTAPLDRATGGRTERGIPAARQNSRNVRGYVYLAAV